jgi:hypothetical protein
MTAKILAFCLLLATNAAAQLATTKAGGMQGDLLSLGLKNGILTASVKVTNTNKDQVAYVLAMGSPSAVDDTGIRFIGAGTNAAQAVGGIAYCTGPPIVPSEPRRCIGSPKMDDNFFPLEQYTEIEPDNSVVILINMATPGAAGKGEKVALSIPIAFRLVKTADVSKEPDTAPAQKLKSLRFGSIGFPMTTVNQEVTSGIVP